MAVAELRETASTESKIQAGKVRSIFFPFPFLVFKLTSVFSFLLSPTKVYKPRVMYQQIGELFDSQLSTAPGGVLPYMGFIGMCGPKGYIFQPFLS